MPSVTRYPSILAISSVNVPGCTISLDCLERVTDSSTIGIEEFGIDVGAGTNAPSGSFSAATVDIPALPNTNTGCSGVTRTDLPLENVILTKRLGALCLLRFAIAVFATLPFARSTEKILSVGPTLTISQSFPRSTRSGCERIASST